MRYILVVFIAAMLVGCSMQSRLNKQFMGKDEHYLESHFDLPKQTLNHEFHRVILFTRTEQLPATTISQGKHTLDNLQSPSSRKTEKFIFYLDENGLVIRCEHQISYNKE